MRMKSTVSSRYRALCLRKTMRKTIWVHTTMMKRRLRKLYVNKPIHPQKLKLRIIQEVDEGDMKTLDALLPSNAGERRTLADIIFSKIEDAEMQTEKSTVIQKKYQGKCQSWSPMDHCF